jgi:Family of unknown function (DUF6445)
MFNPKPEIQALPLYDEQVCYVIDEVFLHPEAWVQEAIKHRARFIEAPSNAYPGIELQMPEDINQGIVNYFNAYLNRRFGIRRIKSSFSRLSMVTRKPEQLMPRQWICHRDGVSIVPNERMLASVIYLYKQPSLGGTSFYRPRQNTQQTVQLIHDSSVLQAEQFSAKYGILPGFMIESNHWFEKIASIEARWNRMIVYDGMVFHSGDIIRPEAMTDDPETGRLSLNGFFSARRNLA